MIDGVKRSKKVEIANSGDLFLAYCFNKVLKHGQENSFDTVVGHKHIDYGCTGS